MQQRYRQAVLGAGVEPQAGEAAKWLAVLTAAAVGLLAVRLVALATNRTDLFFDEAQYWFWSLEPAFGYYSKPPMVAWLIGAATAICGDATACIRSPSPVLYVVAGFGIYAAAVQLYGPRTAAFAGIVFMTLPGVSLSAGIVSTDVPLLAAWAWALAAFVALVRGGGLWTGVALGVCLGIGLNAKYAMAYFLLCIGVYAALVPSARTLLIDRRIWLAIAIAAVLITPNILWNVEHRFATVSHTADNAKLGGNIGNPLKALEFFGSQFGVFGPILFAGLLIVLVRAWRQGLSHEDSLLACFAVPVLAIVTVLAFLSRAHPNWAAVSYVAAAILVTATMVRENDWRWLTGSLGLHLAIVAVLAVATAQAGRFTLPGGIDPFARTLGWSQLAAKVRDRLAEADAKGPRVVALVADTRSMAAELLYYLRDLDRPILAWQERGAPRDHFELTRAYTAGSGEPVLMVSEREADRRELLARFSQVVPLDAIAVPAGSSSTRRAEVAILSGYRER